MSAHFPQNLHFPKQAFCICWVLENIANFFYSDIFASWKVLGFNNSAIAALTDFSDQHVVISNWVLLFKVILGRHIILRLILLVCLLMWQLLVGLLPATRHRIHLSFLLLHLSIDYFPTRL